MRRFVPLTLCFLFALASPVAARGSDGRLAKKHFERGEVFYRQGEFRKALKEYKTALNYKRHTALIFNIAQCHRLLGEHKKAIFFYKLFLSESDQAVNRKEVLIRIKEMERQILQRLRQKQLLGKLSVITVPEGAAVYVDRVKGEPNAVSPALLPLEAGQHLLMVRLKGYKTVQKTVEITARRLAMVSVTLVPESGLQPPRRDPQRRVITRPPPRRDPPRRVDTRPPPRRGVTPPPTGTPVPAAAKPFYKTWWFWTGAGVAVAAVGVGGWAGSTAAGMQSEWDDKRGVVDNPDDFKKKAKTLAAVADAMFGLGAAAAIGVTVGAIIYELGRKKTERQSATTRIAPSCGPTGCGIWVTGRF